MANDYSSQYHQLLLLSEVKRITRLSAPTLWRLEQKGRFPKRVTIGLRRIAWKNAEIEAWLADPAGYISRPCVAA